MNLSVIGVRLSLKGIYLSTCGTWQSSSSWWDKSKREQCRACAGGLVSRQLYVTMKERCLAGLACMPSRPVGSRMAAIDFSACYCTDAKVKRVLYWQCRCGLCDGTLQLAASESTWVPCSCSWRSVEGEAAACLACHAMPLGSKALDQLEVGAQVVAHSDQLLRRLLQVLNY